MTVGASSAKAAADELDVRREPTQVFLGARSLAALRRDSSSDANNARKSADRPGSDASRR